MDASAGLTEPLEKGDIVQVIYDGAMKGEYGMVRSTDSGGIILEYLGPRADCLGGSWGNRDSLRLVAKAHHD